MRWTQTEIDLTLSLLKEGKKYKEISTISGRNEGSIRSKLFKLGEKWTNHIEVNKEIKCLSCLSIFIDYPSNKRKFCSKNCSAIFNNKKREKKLCNFKSKCLNCDKNIKSKYYCSIKCQSTYERLNIFKKIENGDISLYFLQYKKYLIEKHGNKCMECGWNKINPKTKKVPIQIEHIDGDSTNNSLSNLKLLCPNCHSLTPTYGFLNKGNGRKKRYKTN